MFLVLKSLPILGHNVHIDDISGLYITPNSDKIIKIFSDNRRPTKLKEMQALFGILNYFRSYIPNFAFITKVIAKELNNKKFNL